MALGLNDFDRASTLLRPSERVSPEDLEFFGLKCQLASVVAILGPQKVSIFRAHPF
jgi:hypothetical protein